MILNVVITLSIGVTRNIASNMILRQPIMVVSAGKYVNETMYMSTTDPTSLQVLL